MSKYITIIKNIYNRQDMLNNWYIQIRTSGLWIKSFQVSYYCWFTCIHC